MSPANRNKHRTDVRASPMAQEGAEPTMEPTGERPVQGRCNFVKKDGKLCRNGAGKKTNHVGIGHCWLHLGNTESHIKAAETEKWERAAAAFGVARGVTAEQGVVEALHKQAGRVDFYELEVSKLDSPWVRSFGQNGETISEHPAVSAADRALVTLFTMSEKILKLGLAERQVAVNEVQAGMLAKVIMAFLDSPELDLSREQREVGRKLAGKQLRALVQGDTAA